MRVAGAIEQQLTILLRRGPGRQLSTQSGGLPLDPSAYGIMCQLADQGPQRISVLCTTFGLDSSTLTPQVRALERTGMVFRTRDPSDGRSWIVDLSAAGRTTLREVRRHRRANLRRLIAHWTEADVDEFARLLEAFNSAMGRSADQG